MAIQLQDKNRFTATILGSGTCVPSLERSACSVLVEAAGRNLLLDCGPGTMRRLLQAGVTIFQVSFLFLSHFHPDHTGELVSLLFASKYPDGSRRKEPLTLIGGKGLLRFFSGLREVFGEWITLSPGLLQIVELDGVPSHEHTFPGFTIASGAVAHRPESLAYRITDHDTGCSMVYSGDTDYTEDLAALALGAELLICESALPDALKVQGHLTPSLAGKIATLAGVSRLVLTHFYPECEAADMEGQCRRTYSGPLDLAEDLMRIEICGPPLGQIRNPNIEIRNKFE